MFRIIITSIALLLIQVTPSKSSFLDPIQLEAVNAVNAYLNNIEHMEGDFIQINPDSTISEGRFYIRRPGRFRFDYTKPDSLLVVSDSVWLGIIDRELDTLDRYPIRYSPHYVLFKDNVNLLEDARILGIDFYEKFLVLSIEGLTDEEIGEIKGSWNYLVDNPQDKEVDKASLIHWTLGGPWFREQRDLKNKCLPNKMSTGF